jgi:imidazole glycerol-phosphate synthase subunit HisH
VSDREESTEAPGSGKQIAVIDYGIGNLRSAEKALLHLGADAALTSDPAVIANARGVVLPGVGAFGACMRALAASGLEAAARSAATGGRPFLGICVGMQMLFEASTESPGVSGLGLLAGQVERLPDTVKLPQIGWNTLDIVGAPRLLHGLPAPAWCYFVHSYAVLDTEPGTVAAWADYGTRFVAAIERGPLWATQFHPEKSSEVGLRILRNFVDACAPAAVGV